MSNTMSFHIIDREGSRAVGQEEYVAHVRDIEENGLPKMTAEDRARHKAEKAVPGTTWGCCCEDCMEERAEGKMLTAADLRGLIAKLEASA